MNPGSIWRRHLPAAAVFLAGVVALAPCARAATAAPRPRVVVISLDAFGAGSLKDPELPAPTLHALMRQGAHAVSMQPINPTITWPNHTSMVTGVDASRHHVLVNGLIVNQRQATPPRIDMKAPKSELVAVPTVYDAAHAAGLTTAEVDWVAIMDAPTIDWRFPENPDPDGAVEQELVRDGAVTRDELVHFGRPSQAWRDLVYTRAAVDIIRREWGYMLSHPQGTGSTFWESYRNPGDGCVFCSSYTSLAHAWATGPVTALTFGVLGLNPTGTGGRSFDFVPHTADLSFAQGRITTTLGAVEGSWKVAEGAYTAKLKAPQAATGRAGVPTFGERIKVRVDGHLVWDGTRALMQGVRSDGEYVYVDGLHGNHTIRSERA